MINERAIDRLLMENVHIWHFAFIVLIKMYFRTCGKDLDNEVNICDGSGATFNKSEPNYDNKRDTNRAFDI